MDTTLLRKWCRYADIHDNSRRPDASECVGRTWATWLFGLKKVVGLIELYPHGVLLQPRFCMGHGYKPVFLSPGDIKFRLMTPVPTASVVRFATAGADTAITIFGQAAHEISKTLNVPASVPVERI